MYVETSVDAAAQQEADLAGVVASRSGGRGGGEQGTGPGAVGGVGGGAWIVKYRPGT